VLLPNSRLKREGGGGKREEVREVGERWEMETWNVFYNNLLLSVHYVDVLLWITSFKSLLVYFPLSLSPLSLFISPANSSC
jgi:hypothetical protein